MELWTVYPIILHQTTDFMEQESIKATNTEVHPNWVGQDFMLLALYWYPPNAFKLKDRISII